MTGLTEHRRPGLKYVIADGNPLTMTELLAPGMTRWVLRREEEVVASVRGGLSRETACSHYSLLSVENFLAWQRSIDRHSQAESRKVIRL